MRVRSPKVVRSLCLFAAVLAITTVSGCAAAQPSTLQYLKALESSHELDAKAVKACTQGYTPKQEPLAARNATLSFVRKIMFGSPELQKDSILSSHRQGYAAICIFKTTDYGKPVTVGEYHLTPPNDGSGGAGDGGGILEW
jgi:hypothetical protein